MDGRAQVSRLTPETFEEKFSQTGFFITLGHQMARGQKSSGRTSVPWVPFAVSGRRSSFAPKRPIRRPSTDIGALLKKAFLLLSVFLPFFLLSACEKEPSASEIAKSRLESFQGFLRTKNSMGLMGVLTESSRRFVPALLKKTPGELAPILLSVKKEGIRIEALMRDPNPGAVVPKGTFVLVKEDGEWRVDLVATAGANSHEVALPGNSTRIVPSRLSKKQLDEAKRIFEASYKRSSGSK